MWAAAAIAGGAIIGGAIQANAAKKAAGIQGAASDTATAEQARQYDLAREDTAPYREAGGAAVQRIQQLLGLAPQVRKPEEDPRYKTIYDKIVKEIDQPHIDRYGRSMLDPSLPTVAPMEWTAAKQDQLRASLEDKARQEYISRYGDPSDPNAPVNREMATISGALNKPFTVADFNADPVTQLSMKYGLDLGTKAIDRGAGAAGLRNSGATLKALTRFGQDYAGSKAAESSSRFYGDQDRIFNRLAGVAGTGQTATMGTNALGQQSAQNIGNIMTASGNARGASAIAQGNAYGGALNTIGNYYGQQAMLDKILKSRTYGNDMDFTR